MNLQSPFASSPVVFPSTETLYVLEIPGGPRVEIRFDEHNKFAGDAEYADERDGFELDRDEIDLVCDYINANQG